VDRKCLGTAGRIYAYLVQPGAAVNMGRNAMDRVRCSVRAG
jgi:hypothetical protein